MRLSHQHIEVFNWRGGLTVLYSGTSLFNLITTKCWGNPCPASYKVVDMRDFGQHPRNDLDTTGPVSNHRDSLVLANELASHVFCKREDTYGIIIALIPASTMHQFSFEVMETGNRRPFPVIQRTSSRDQYISLILVYRAFIEVLDLFDVSRQFTDFLCI